MFRNHPVLFVLALLLIPVGVGIVALIVWYVWTHASTLTITDQELRYEKGILSKDRIELKLTSIRAVRINQSLFQRMFGTGDVSIYTAGDDPEVVAPGMPEPQRIRDLTG